MWLHEKKNPEVVTHNSPVPPFRPLVINVGVPRSTGVRASAQNPPRPMALPPGPPPCHFQAWHAAKPANPIADRRRLPPFTVVIRCRPHQEKYHVVQGFQQFRERGKVKTETKKKNCRCRRSVNRHRRNGWGRAALAWPKRFSGVLR